MKNRSTKQRSGCLYATSVQWNFPFWDFLALPMLVSLHLHLYRCLYWFMVLLCNPTRIISLLIGPCSISTAVNYSGISVAKTDNVYGQPGRKISGTSWKKCYFHSNLHISGICHRNSSVDDSCQKRLRIPWICCLSHCLYRL